MSSALGIANDILTMPWLLWPLTTPNLSKQTKGSLIVEGVLKTHLMNSVEECCNEVILSALRTLFFLNQEPGCQGRKSGTVNSESEIRSRKRRRNTALR